MLQVEYEPKVNTYNKSHLYKIPRNLRPLTFKYNIS